MDLRRPLSSLKGIGPRRAAALEGEGLLVVADLLLHLPYRYEDRQQHTPIASLVAGQKALVSGVVFKALLRRPGRKKTLIEALIEDDSGRLRAVWFNQPFLRDRMAPGTRVTLFGPVAVDPRARRYLTMSSPQVERAAPEAPAPSDAGRVVAIHERLAGLSPTVLRRLIAPIAAAIPDDLPDPLPPAIRERLGVGALGRALREVHVPPHDLDAAAIAALNDRRSPAHLRLILEELFLMQLGLALGRRRNRSRTATAFVIDDRVRTACRGLLPFRLTAAQKRASREIADDLQARFPMRRLLQGDVGSGKTAVALLAMAIVAENGCQTAFLAPTEILAEQHFLTLRRLLRDRPYEVALLTAALSAAERRDTIERIAAGQAQIAVGTHALLEPAVRFARLGLAVIDEQHRFGVLQRERLTSKGHAVDTLVMTATPIPRTLALTTYGDLDVSVLDETPPGRGAIQTLQRPSRARREVVERVAREVAAGRQAYVVHPLIEESEATEGLRTATAALDEWRTAIPGARVALLHGRMPAAQRDEVMGGFVRGAIQVLVTTTVIEVGIDVANATVMVVEHAERFGLAQLHQLRGRIGRGPAPSLCVLVSHGRLTPLARARLQAMLDTRDGFVIAERDLALRGPGELLGTRQSGLARLRVAQLPQDTALLEQAREEARRLVADEPASAEALWGEGAAWERRFGLGEVG